MPHYVPNQARRGSLEERVQKLQQQRREFVAQIKAIDDRLWAIRKSQDPPKTVEEAIQKLGRRRDRDWMMSMLGSLSKGVDMDEAADEATRRCYPALRSKEAVRSQALANLRRPDMCQIVEDVFALRGFSIEDAIDTHIGHVKGTHTKETVLPSGEVLQVKIPPSWPALAAYYKMILPSQAQKVEVAHTNVDAMLRTIEGEGAGHVMRTVGQVLDVAPAENPDDRDPFEGLLEDDPDEEDDDA